MNYTRGLDFCRSCLTRYKNYLIDHVTVSLHELQTFIEHANDMLQRQVHDNDVQGLITMMTFLGQVRARETYTDDMSEPIKDTIELLKSYAYEVPPTVYAMLDELPERWIMIKKLTAQMKQHIAPMQTRQVTLIRCAMLNMEKQQTDLRQRFQRHAPFDYQTTEPYQGTRRNRNQL
jgi:dynein heavy chain, axonemal